MAMSILKLLREDSMPNYLGNLIKWIIDLTLKSKKILEIHSLGRDRRCLKHDNYESMTSIVFNKTNAHVHFNAMQCVLYCYQYYRTPGWRGAGSRPAP